MNKKDFLDDLTLEELNELEREIQRRLRPVERDTITEQINKNKELLGRCFCDEDTGLYVKVISIFSTNERRVECICIRAGELPEKDSVWDLNGYGNGIFGVYQYDGVYTDSISIFNSIFSNEISVQSFEEILYDHTERLIKWTQEVVKI